MHKHNSRDANASFKGTKKAARVPGPPCNGFYHAPASHAAITPITFAAMLMLHRRRALWPPLAARRRRRKTWTAVMWRRSGATGAAVHAIMLRLRLRPLEMLRAHAMVLAAVLISELLGAGATTRLKAGRRAARSAESRISTRTAELLRLLPSAKSTPLPALWAAAPVHLPILRAALR